MPARNRGQKKSAVGGMIPLLAMGTIIRAAGEVVGYTRGANARDQKYIDEYELHKIRFTSFLAQ